MSFWGTLASIGSSFIPGVGPLIAPLIGGAVNGLTGGGGGGTGSTGTAPLSPEVQALLKTLKAPGTGADNSATNEAEGYYNTILHGSQENTRSLLGPDVDTIMSQYDNASKASAELGPRGGGRTAIQAEAPFKKAGVYGQLVGQAKKGAAEGLTTIGGQKTAAATARRGQTAGVLGTLTGANTAANQLAFDKQQEQNKQYGTLGKGIGGILTNLINGKKNSGGGGSSDSTGGLNLSNFLSNDPYQGNETGD